MAWLITKLLLVVNISSGTGEKAQPHQVRGGDPPLRNGHPRGLWRHRFPHLLLPYLVAYELGAEIFLIIDFHWLLIYKG